MARATITRKIEIYDPSALPAWVPEIGSIANVSSNTMNDVRQIGIAQTGGTGVGSFAAILGAWSGIAFAPWYGALGSLIATGGGHDDYNGTDVYRYDIAAQAWSRIKDSCDIFIDSDGYCADQTTGWMWADTGGTDVQVGEPFTSHFYAYLLALPPSAISGSAPNGWLFTPGRRSMPEGGQRGTGQSHALALGTATKWDMIGSPLPRDPEHCPAIYDSTRNRVLQFRDNPSSSIAYIDLTTGSPGTLNLNGSISAYYATGAYSPGDDLYLMAHWSGSALTLVVIDPTDATRYIASANTTGGAPTAANVGGWDWVEAWRSWVFYPGSGNDVWTLKAPADPRTGTWAWGKQTLSGAPLAKSANPHYTRFRYVPAIDRFLWVSTTTQAVQCFGVEQP